MGSYVEIPSKGAEQRKYNKTEKRRNTK